MCHCIVLRINPRVNVYLKHHRALPLLHDNVHSDSSSHFTDTTPEFHEHPDHVEFKYDAVPGPSNENLLKSKKFKKDPSIEPSEVIYMQLKER